MRGTVCKVLVDWGVESERTYLNTALCWGDLLPPSLRGTLAQARDGRPNRICRVSKTKTDLSAIKCRVKEPGKCLVYGVLDIDELPISIGFRKRRRILGVNRGWNNPGVWCLQTHNWPTCCQSTSCWWVLVCVLFLHRPSLLSPAAFLFFFARITVNLKDGNVILARN